MIYIYYCQECHYLIPSYPSWEDENYHDACGKTLVDIDYGRLVLRDTGKFAIVKSVR